jgi:hypothetical protein
VVVGCYLAIPGFWWIGHAMRFGEFAVAGGAPRPVRWPALVHGLMSAGMGLAVLAMM